MDSGRVVTFIEIVDSRTAVVGTCGRSHRSVGPARGTRMNDYITQLGRQQQEVGKRDD
jgi:hypothetical protein